MLSWTIFKWSAITWVIFSIISVATYPSEEQFFADPEGSTALYGFAYSIGAIAGLSAIVSLVIFGFQKVLSKETKNETYHGPVHRGNITATGHAKVAAAGSNFTDSSTNLSETLEFKSEVQNTLRSVESAISSSNSSSSEIEAARKLINDSVEKISQTGMDKAKTVDVVEELYNRLMETGIPGKLYSSVYRWLTAAKG